MESVLFSLQIQYLSLGKLGGGQYGRSCIFTGAASFPSVGIFCYVTPVSLMATHLGRCTIQEFGKAG